MMIWCRLAEFLKRGERVCRVAIAEVEGSSPREAGAALLVAGNGGFTGTIGGGALEWKALALAQRLLSENPEGKGLSRRFSLGPDLGQCCGGRISLLFEAFSKDDLAWISALAEAETQGDFQTEGRADKRGIFRRKILTENSAPCGHGELSELFEHHGESRTPLLLFGAGHVGRALILALAPLPFRVRWIDTRPDAFPGHHPANTTPVFTADPTGEVNKAVQGTLVLAMTHSHALDLAIMAESLVNPVIAFSGVIGSTTKRARFVSQLRASGLPDADIARMTCPIGVTTIAGKEPAVIAAGIVVQLLEARERDLAMTASLTSSQPRQLRQQTIRRFRFPA